MPKIIRLESEGPFESVSMTGYNSPKIRQALNCLCKVLSRSEVFASIANNNCFIDVTRLKKSFKIVNSHSDKLLEPAIFGCVQEFM